MSETKHVGELEISQDIQHQSLEWKIERIGWIVMALLLLAALLGLLGHGPISSATAGEKESNLWAEYNRFERYQGPTKLKVNVGAGAVHDGKARLWLNREFVESIELSHIDPEPESVALEQDRFVYTFNLSNLNQETKLIYYFEPNKYGKMPIQIGLEDRTEINFQQFIYP